MDVDQNGGEEVFEDAESGAVEVLGGVAAGEDDDAERTWWLPGRRWRPRTAMLRRCSFRTAICSCPCFLCRRAHPMERKLFKKSTGECSPPPPGRA